MSSTLTNMLKNISLQTISEIYLQAAEIAVKKKITYVDFLEELVRAEIQQRHEQAVSRLLKQAKLPRNKLLKTFDLSRIPNLTTGLVRTLQQGDFIDRCENILIFGNPGTGKSHLSIALGREWCMQARKCLYLTAANLVQQLLIAKSKLALNNFIKKLDRFEVLIIDDISYIPYSKEESDLLFVILAERYEQRSLVITSNLVFSQWDNIFKDKMTTTAAIDRLVHHATIIELNAESYRISEAKNNKSCKRKMEVNTMT